MVADLVSNYTSVINGILRPCGRYAKGMPVGNYRSYVWQRTSRSNMCAQESRRA
jgi:hypothetical protein